MAVLQRWLADRLPEPMIPADFILLDSLPLTGSGKVDRRALSARRDTASAADAANVSYTAPRTSLEQSVAAVWQSVLSREHVGIHDNFFAVGGNSLLLVQVHARLREALRREVTMVQLFRHPTIQALARFLEGEDRESPALAQAEERARRAEAGKQEGGAADRQKQFLEARRKQREAGRRTGGPR